MIKAVSGGKTKMPSVKRFAYTNDLGFKKEIVVYPPEDGMYPTVMWEMEHGEFCGAGAVTLEKLKDFLEYRGIDMNELLNFFQEGETN